MTFEEFYKSQKIDESWTVRDAASLCWGWQEHIINKLEEENTILYEELERTRRELEHAKYG